MPEKAVQNIRVHFVNIMFVATHSATTTTRNDASRLNAPRTPPLPDVREVLVDEGGEETHHSSSGGGDGGDDISATSSNVSSINVGHVTPSILYMKLFPRKQPEQGVVLPGRLALTHRSPVGLVSSISPNVFADVKKPAVMRLLAPGATATPYRPSPKELGLLLI